MTLKLTVIGNLTRDAEMRNTQSGDAVLNFSVARNDRRTKEVTYVDCSIWGQLAKSLEPYLKKGQKVYCDGDFGTRVWEGKTFLTCRIRDIELVGGRSDNQQSDNNQDNGGSNNGYPEDEIPW
jgi:single-strand DNA-binding protein